MYIGELQIRLLQVRENRNSFGNEEERGFNNFGLDTIFSDRLYATLGEPEYSAAIVMAKSLSKLRPNEIVAIRTADPKPSFLAWYKDGETFPWP